jgi:NitT/TauT family transport system substrate-binding protein
MKKAGMLNPRTDVAALAERAFVNLEGVTDQWVQSVAVEKVPGGDVPANRDIQALARMILSEKVPNCCIIRR